MTAVQRRYGPTGPTGPQGATGPIVTGPTGPDGLFRATSILYTAVPAVINQFNKNDKSVAKYLIQAMQGVDSYATEFQLLHNGTDIDWVEYATLSIGTLEVNLTAAVEGINIRVYADSPTATSMNPVYIKIARIDN